MRAALCVVLCLVPICVLAGPGSPSADDFARQSIPWKWLEAVLPEDLPPLDYPAWANDLDKARLEAFSGRYKKSLMTLLKLEPAAKADPVEVALIRASALAATGRRQEAIDALAQPAAIADDPRAQVKRAAILAEVGRIEQSIALLKEHLARYPDSIGGHYQLGQCCELAGDLDGARAAYGWFVAEPHNYLAKWQKEAEKGFDDAEQVTLIGRAIDRWATLSGSYQKLPELHDALLNMFVRAYDVIDRGYWPAHVAAAEYYLSHDNAKMATDELKAAARGNPQDLRALDLLAKIAIDAFDFDRADEAVRTIRQIDRTSVAADLLESRNLLAQRRPADAARPVQRVLDEQPRNLEALGLLAATWALQLRDAKTAEILKRVEQIDPDNASAYFEVAEQLGAMRQYPRSAAMYKVAIERAPWWTAARNGLGLLYTQSGDEDDAKATLDAAHQLDPFNLRTTNYLRLLDDLAKFTKKESDHFIVMYDPEIDPIIPEYFSEYLESIHALVSKAYNCEPKVKTYIEVFPTHDAFSVRTTGSPWIGTVGASTGRVIALVSPRAGEQTMGAFNWANVLRHEYTHTVTLAATDNRIPHWMTEGLAVTQEQSPLQWEWVPLLYDAVSSDKLFTIEDLTWGFIRPRKPTDRTLAYAESLWVCQYIEQKHGHEAILKMLDHFRAGGSEADAFQKVLGVSESQFQSGFFAWARQQISTWGYDEQSSEKYDALRDKGEGLIKAKKYADAVEVWEQIAAIRPVDALPHQRLAGLYLTKQVNEPAKAIEHLKVLHQVSLKDNRYAKRIARIYRDISDWANAKAFAMQSVYIDPYDLDAHKLLAEIADKAGDARAAERERRVIPVLEEWIKKNRPKPE